MTNPFRSTRRGSPCPICGDITHRCRNKATEFDLPEFRVREDIQYFCINYRNDIAGYKYSGETKDARWGKYITLELSEELSAIWSAYVRQNFATANNTKPKLKLERQKERIVEFLTTKSNYQHLLKIPPRDREIRKLLCQLKLKPEHRRALQQRGVTQSQIERYQFKSISYLQRLETTVSNRLAGIAPGGLALSTKYTGLLIPIQDYQGRYLGWQTRLDYNKDTRYVWPTDEHSSAHLAEYGELPLAFFLPLENINSNYIGIVEGLGFKGIHTANRFRQVVLGASGGQFASSPQQLREYLNRASTLTQKKLVLLYPDGGAVLNRLVLIQYQRTASLIVKQGYEIKVAWWGQITKARGDIDEYSGGFDLISIREFFQIAKKFVKYSTINNNESKTKPQRMLERS